jgi:hypothetical protein
MRVDRERQETEEERNQQGKRKEREKEGGERTCAQRGERGGGKIAKHWRLNDLEYHINCWVKERGTI